MNSQATKDNQFQPIQFDSRAAEPMHVTLGASIRTVVWLLLLLSVFLILAQQYGISNIRNLQSIAIMCAGLFLCAVFVPGLRVAAQWEKAVILRLGHFVGVRGPGVFYVIPGLEAATFVDTRLLTLEIPSQHTITKDNVPVQVDGAVFFQVVEPGAAITSAQDYRLAVLQYAQAAMRDAVGMLSLDELLQEREYVQDSVRNTLEKRLATLGIHVDSIRIFDVDVPEDLKRMMSRQASAEREKRANITKSEGDKIAALNLAQAARTMIESPGAMHLRALQSIDGLGGSPSNTILLFPLEMLEAIWAAKPHLMPTEIEKRRWLDNQERQIHNRVA